MAPERRPVALPVVVAASATVLGILGGIVAFALAFLRSPSLRDASVWPLTLLLGLSLSPLVAGAVGQWDAALYLARRAISVAFLYGVWHVVFGRLLAPASQPFLLGWVVVLTGFVVLFGVQCVLLSHPQGRLARALQPRLFAGLYLDEVFTRWTFRLWPPRLKPRDAGGQPLPAQAALEVGS